MDELVSGAFGLPSGYLRATFGLPSGYLRATFGLPSGYLRARGARVAGPT